MRIAMLCAVVIVAALFVSACSKPLSVLGYQATSHIGGMAPPAVGVEAGLGVKPAPTPEPAPVVKKLTPEK